MVTIHTVTHFWEPPDADSGWRAIQATPTGASLQTVFAPADFEAVRAAFAEVLRDEFGDRPLRFEQVARIGVGRALVAGPVAFGL